MKRLATFVGVLLLMPGMVPMVAAQTPEATPGASPVAADSEWRITTTREIDVDGEPLILSPDGQWLAGIGPEDDSICVWDVETLAPTCAGEGLRIVPFPMSPSLVWAPDSSAVTFIDGTAQLVEPTEVMLFDVASGELSNLTNVGPRGGEPIFLGTAWTADSRRIVYSTFSEIGWIDHISGELGQVPLGDQLSGAFIGWPIVVTPDDTVIFRLERAGDDEHVAGIWRIELDGSNLRKLYVEDDIAPSKSPVLLRVTADGDFASILSIEALGRNYLDNVFYLAELDDGEVTHLAIDGSRYVLGPPVFSPSGSFALVHGGEDPRTLLHVLDLETGESSPVAGSRNEPYITWMLKSPTWAKNGTVFIPSDEGGTLLTLEHTS